MLGKLKVKSVAVGTVTITPRNADNEPLIEDDKGNAVSLSFRAPEPADFFAARELVKELLINYPEWNQEFAGRIALLGICHLTPEADQHPAGWYAEMNTTAPDVLMYIMGEFNTAFPSRLAVEASEAIRNSKNG